MNTRKLAITAGVLYLITHVTSVAAVGLYQPLVGAANPMSGTWTDSPVILGTLLDVILALAVVGSAAALYPVVKKKAPAIALANMGLRTLEAGIISVGAVSLLGVVTMRQDALVGVDTVALRTAGEALVRLYDWTFLVGPNLVLATSTTFLAYALFRSRLVPRWIAALGLVGAPVIFIRAVGSMFGLYEQVTVWGAILTIPIFAWELSLAFRLIFKGFNEAALPDSEIEGSPHQERRLVTATW